MGFETGFTHPLLGRYTSVLDGLGRRGPAERSSTVRALNDANAEAQMSLTMRNTLDVIRGIAFLGAVCIGVPLVLMGYLGAVLSGVGLPAA